MSLFLGLCLSSLTVEGCFTGMWAVCIVCKNKPSGQRYSLRIYIKQLRKQSFWTQWGRVVMQQTTPWDSMRERKTDFTTSDSYIWLVYQHERNPSCFYILKITNLIKFYIYLATVKFIWNFYSTFIQIQYPVVHQWCHILYLSWLRLVMPCQSHIDDLTGEQTFPLTHTLINMVARKQTK